MRVPVLCGLVLLTPGLAAVPASAADSYHFESDHTYAMFRYSHFGLSHPTGKIMGAAGTLVIDADDPTKDVVDVTLDMNTLSSGLPVFDTTLKSKDYFDAAQFPQAAFKSTSVERTGDTTANVTGDLTLHGVTKSVVLNVTFNKKAFNPAIFKTGVGFSATGHISRRDFGVSKFEPFIDDGIDLIIEAEAY
ncbi:MAG: YceI family protein [Asticcacaulis sp.]